MLCSLTRDFIKTKVECHKVFIRHKCVPNVLCTDVIDITILQGQILHPNENEENRLHLLKKNPSGK